MLDETQGDLLDVWRTWTPDAQREALDLLRQAEAAQWRPFYCAQPLCDGRPHDDWTWEHGRADQRPPKWADPWLVLLFRGGRGSGKTRGGSEITHRVTAHTPRVGLIAATGPDLRDTIIEGVSGILATAAPGRRPLWEPSKKKLTWPNGCIGQGFSAEEPDRLRGPELGFVWADEPAHYPLIDEVWSNMHLGLRDKRVAHPKIVATTTPKPVPWMKKINADPMTVVRVVSTYANLHNLAEPFRNQVLDRYEGTRTGRQELHGEILDDVEGALWAWDMFDRVPDHPELLRIGIGVDPAGTTNKRSDDTGIIAAGIDAAGHIYVLRDRTGKYSPNGWATIANDLHDDLHADALVAEKNYGGDMVKHTLENSGYTGARIILVESRRGKELRAEPIVARYEKHMIHHVGDLTDLEAEQTSWVPGEGDSPNRVDALVHVCTELLKHLQPAAVANPRDLGRRSPTNRYLHAV